MTRCEIEMKTDFNELLPAKAENKKVFYFKNIFLNIKLFNFSRKLAVRVNTTFNNALWTHA